jgi:hypothetical protein
MMEHILLHPSYLDHGSEITLFFNNLCKICFLADSHNPNLIHTIVRFLIREFLRHMWPDE